jgi:hypothetical protein
VRIVICFHFFFTYYACIITHIDKYKQTGQLLGWQQTTDRQATACIMIISARPSFTDARMKQQQQQKLL